VRASAHEAFSFDDGSPEDVALEFFPKDVTLNLVSNALLVERRQLLFVIDIDDFHGAI
jgi:hypothetical protein